MAAPSPKTGVTWMLISAVAFTAMGAIAKALTSSVPVATILIWRNSFSLLLILGILTVLGRLGALRTRQAGGHLTRATLGTLSLVCMLEAYARLDFALATTLAYTTPFWVILASALLLGERPNLRRTLAAVAGFGGVIIIIRPLPALSAGVVLALASALLGGLSLSFVRKLSAGEQPLTLVFYFFLFGTLVTAPFGLVYWSMPSAAEIGLLAAMGFSGALGVVSTAHAYRVAEASVVAPIDFLRLPLAGVLGVVLFNESFSPYLASGTVVMLTAMYFVVTEPRRGGAPRPPQ